MRVRDSLRSQDSARAILGIAGLVALGFCAALSDTRFVRQDGTPVAAQISAAEFATYAERAGYHIDGVRHGQRPVPRLILSTLPGDLARGAPTEQRKQLFLKGLLPVVLAVNESIAAERAQLLQLQQKHDAKVPFSGRDVVWLAEIGSRYDIAGASDAGIAELLRRVDTVPVSLALAQAAIESGWGTSRFAQAGNALFGQRTYGGDGLQPAGVPADAGFRVRDFGDLASAVRAYMDNLNTHEAYRDFRAARAGLRRDGYEPDGMTLARTLAHYSEKGAIYVDQVRSLIGENDLAALDGARLADRGSVATQTTSRGAVPIPHGGIDGNI